MSFLASPFQDVLVYLLSLFLYVCFWIVRKENKQQPKPSCADVSRSQSPGEQGKMLPWLPVTPLSLSPL